MKLRNLFLKGFIYSLVVTSAVTIGIVLVGQFGEVEVKILVSALSIGVYSLIALACSTALKESEYRWVGFAGLVTCAFGLIFALLTNWQIIKPEFGNIFKFRFLLLNFSIALGITSLIVKIRSRHSMVNLAKHLTIISTSVTSIIIAYLLLLKHDPGPEELMALMKILAISSILGLLGLISTPLLHLANGDAALSRTSSLNSHSSIPPLLSDQKNNNHSPSSSQMLYTSLIFVMIAAGCYVFYISNKKPIDPFLTINQKDDSFRAVVSPPLKKAASPNKNVSNQGQRRGMTWGLMQTISEFVQVGCDGRPVPANHQRCEPYSGDTLCEATLSLLCIDKSKHLVIDANMQNEYRLNWSGGEVKLLNSVQGISLTSLEAAHGLCRKAFGDSWQIASFHDGGGWRFTAKGSINTNKRFWVYIRDQKANCWD